MEGRNRAMVGVKAEKMLALAREGSRVEAWIRKGSRRSGLRLSSWEGQRKGSLSWLGGLAVPLRSLSMGRVILTDIKDL